jgi:formate hydrogenlyase transcriptional activator
MSILESPLWNTQHPVPHLNPPFTSSADGIIGESSAIRGVLENIRIVAATDATVLILGETGSGKALVARAIHEQSRRRNASFVTVNCAAIPRDLLESEMLGHEKGAFTGAYATKIGRFELADKGTLFLDEVGDMPQELQPKLLRVLQEQEVERLGGLRSRKVDVRVVAATNRNLADLCDTKSFREDLYYRLNVFPISIPPLRERREDIPLLVKHFTQRAAERFGKSIETIPSDAMDAFINHSWPGNVRELQNFIERSVILSRGDTLHPPLAELKPRQLAPQTVSEATTLQDFEREHILRTLRASNWVIGGPRGAAVRLGLKRTSLIYRIQKLGISCRPA